MVLGGGQIAADRNVSSFQMHKCSLGRARLGSCTNGYRGQAVRSCPYTYRDVPSFTTAPHELL
jgi:hypothetical protein